MTPATVGDKVLIETGGKTLDDKPKLQAYYSGPHPVVKATGATVTVDTGPKTVTLPRERTFKPSTPLRDAPTQFVARHWGSIPPTYVGSTGGVITHTAENTDNRDLALPELGIVGNNWKKVHHYKATAYGHNAPILLNNFRSNTATTRKGHAKPSVYLYAARELVGLAAVALTPTLAGLITSSHEDAITVTDTTGATHNVTLAFAQANLLGIPATKNWGHLITSHGATLTTSPLGSSDWIHGHTQTHLSRGADEAGTLRDTRDILPRDQGDATDSGTLSPHTLSGPFPHTIPGLSGREPYPDPLPAPEG